MGLLFFTGCFVGLLGMDGSLVVYSYLRVMIPLQERFSAYCIGYGFVDWHGIIVRIVQVSHRLVNYNIIITAIQPINHRVSCHIVTSYIPNRQPINQTINNPTHPHKPTDQPSYTTPTSSALLLSSTASQKKPPSHPPPPQL